MDILEALDVVAKLPTQPQMAKACAKVIRAQARKINDLDRSLTATQVAMGNFCDRVEAGEFRWHRTYTEFCKILGRKTKP